MTTKRVYLKVALLRRGLSARQLAARLGISEWTLSRILNGRQDADSALMKRLHRALATQPPRRRKSRRHTNAGAGKRAAAPAAGATAREVRSASSNTTSRT
jgi:transcriptional regulator with XRE-family HTH domain